MIDTTTSSAGGVTPRGDTPPAGGELRGSLTTPRIVLLVVAAAAPLAAVVGTVPLAFALGNGVGVPGMFLFAGLVLLCFAVGYAAMSRRIVNAGGFYTYLSLGLGRPVALAGGFAAVVAYNAAAIGLLGAFGYFAHITALSHGLDVPWEVWSGGAVLLLGVLAYRQIDLSARVLAALMVAEIGVLVVVDVAVLAKGGGHTLPLNSISPDNVFSGAVGVTMMFAFMSFIGFESAALYGEETKNPRRSVPLATYLSVIVIAGFYALTSWVAVGATGEDRLREVAGTQLGDLFFSISTRYVSSDFTTVMQVLLCTSLLAATLALHNAANRYTFVLGRERVLPAWFGQAHPRHHSPHRTAIVHLVVMVVVAGAFALAGLDPYTSLATTLLGLGTLGIVLLQAAAGFAVVGFFWRRPDRSLLKTVLAPLVGAVGLSIAAGLLVDKFDLLTGTTNPVINALPWVFVATTVLGVGYAAVLRRTRPERYAELAASPQPEQEVAAVESPVAAGSPV